MGPLLREVPVIVFVTKPRKNFLIIRLIELINYGDEHE